MPSCDISELDTLAIITRDAIDRQIGFLQALRKATCEAIADRYREPAIKTEFEEARVFVLMNPALINSKKFLETWDSKSGEA